MAVQITPPSPSSSDDVIISSTNEFCVFGPFTISQAGFSFTARINHAGGCVPENAATIISFPVGKLAPGSYTVAILHSFDGGTLISAATGAFVVVPASPLSVPASDPVALVLMAAMLALVAGYRLMCR